MDWILNSLLGSIPARDSNVINIYAFQCAKGNFIETIDFHFPLDYVQRKFVDKLTEEELQKLPASAQKTYGIISDIKQKNKVSSSIHVVFDRRRQKLILTEENTNPHIRHRGTESYEKSVELLRALARWVMDSPDIFGDVDPSSLNDLRVNNNVWSHKNFAVYNIYELPQLVELLDSSGKNWDEFRDVSIVLVDFEDDGLVSHIEKQIGREFLESEPYSCTLTLAIDNYKINPPLIVVNSRGKEGRLLYGELYTFILENIGSSHLERMKSLLDHQHFSGYDVQDIFYLNFRDPDRVSDGASVFNKDASIDTKDKVKSLAEKFDLDMNNKRLMDFFKNFLIYRAIFPLSDDTKNYKVFYNMISIPAFGERASPSPATENEGLFNAIFTVRGDPLISDNRAYYLLSSRYCFPDETLSLFTGFPAAEKGAPAENETTLLHDTVEFNTKNGMVSQYSFVDPPYLQPAETVFYRVKANDEFSRRVIESLGDEVKDNRIDEKVTVKNVSEFPYVYQEVSKTFQRFGVDFREILVILVFDPGKPEMLGGYLSPRRVNEEAVVLVRGYNEFKPPFIIINMANKRMHIRENLSSALIHEARHFMDDILIELGIENPRLFDREQEVEPRSMSEQIERHKKYLRQGTEVNAHAEQALGRLRYYDLDYLKKNWYAVKTRIIMDEFMLGREIGDDEYGVADEYSKILDKALELYEQELLSTSPQI